jgi:tetratricopeptide (TPR) repeat protein
VLETASVIGMEAPLELLGAVTNLDVGRLLGILSELAAADLMYESLSSGQAEFRFKHTLTREAAAARIPMGQRRSLHARTVAAIETLYGHRRDEWIDRLADHASRAGLSEKAYIYCAEACRRAIERSANRHAVTFFEKSLAALSDLADNDDRRRKEIDLRLMALNALLPLGEQERIGQLLYEAKESAVSVNDAHRLAKVELLLTLFLWEGGSHEAALTSGATALALATENGLDRVSLAARLHIGIVHYSLGRFRQTLQLHRPVLEELIAAGLEKQRFNWAAYPSVITRAFCADCCISLGDYAEAERLIREGQALSEELGHPYSRAMIETVLGRYHLARDEPAVARGVFENADRRCRDDEVHTMVPAVVAGLGTALARSGSPVEALQLLQDALDRQIYRRAGNPALYYLLMAIGEAHRIAGHLDEALDKAGEAERLARRNAEMAHLAQALYLHGAIHAHQDPTAAERTYLDARRCAEQHEMRPLAARCWLGLADIEARLGRPEASLTFERARQLFLELGLEHRVHQPSL